MSEIEYPDFISYLMGREHALETEAGIQFTALIQPARCGEKAFVKLMLQNALDVPIIGEILIDVPHKASLFKKSFLSSLDNVPFRLDAVEVVRLDIPIQTTLETPEGEYEITITVDGEPLAKGNRVREARRKIGTDMKKSAVLSLGVSALLFPLVGGVAIYRVSNEVVGKLRISDRAVNIDRSPLQHRKTVIFSRQDAQLYANTFLWLQKSLDAIRSFDGIVLISEALQPQIEGFLKELNIHITENEALWISRYVATNFQKAIDNFAVSMSLRVTKKLKQGSIKVDDLKPDLDVVYQVALKPEIDGLSKQQRLRLLALSSAFAWYLIISTIARVHKRRISSENILKEAMRVREKAMEVLTKRQKDDIICLVVLSMLYVAVAIASEIFPEKKERLRQLETLKNISDLYKSDIKLESAFKKSQSDIAKEIQALVHTKIHSMSF